MFSSVRAFNYQPGYAATGVEIWRGFRADQISNEISRGNDIFPHINTIRIWLSFDAWLIESRTSERVPEMLGILERSGLRAVVTLFNGWHSFPDFGGITPEHMSLFAGQPGHFGPLYRECKALGAKAPITVGIHPGVPLEMVTSMSDLLSNHPYWVHNAKNANKQAYEKKLDAEVAYARKVAKPILATECCWGDLNDKVRVDSIRYTLTQLKQRGIGWLVYLLHHSLIADAHRPEFGPVGGPGNLAFIEADDSLRPGHEVFNEF